MESWILQVSCKANKGLHVSFARDTKYSWFHEHSKNWIHFLNILRTKYSRWIYHYSLFACWVIFHDFVIICWLLFKKKIKRFFKKKLRIAECQRVWTQIRTNILSVLIWVQNKWPVSIVTVNLIYLMYINSLPTGNFFHAFLPSADFFKSNFLKFFFSVKQFGSRSGPTFSGLFWVQSVCKGYEQMTLAGNELRKPCLCQMIIFLCPQIIY